MDIERGYHNLGYLDRLACGDSLVHRLDPRAKALATVAFVMVVVSYPRHEVSGLVPMFFLPVMVSISADVPISYILRKLIYLSPLPLMVGIFNPILDTAPALMVAGHAISGGWLSFASIMLRFALTASAALLLIATTPFPALCAGLGRIGLPRVFVAQLMFLYRFIFILVEEGMRMVRARGQRNFHSRRSLGEFTSLAGVLFIRTYERSDRVYNAMLARGFDGRVRTLDALRMHACDWVAVAALAVALILLRAFGLAERIGSAVLG